LIGPLSSTSLTLAPSVRLSVATRRLPGLAAPLRALGPQHAVGRADQQQRQQQQAESDF
jgi:hypothetical protein